MTVTLDGDSLTLGQVERVARQDEPVVLGAGAVDRMTESRRRVERVLARGDAVYGMTTGLGERKRHRVDPDDTVAFNRLLLDSHRVGTGPIVAADLVRATMLRLANGFAKGTTGVRPMLAERVVDALNDRRGPPVRMLGSVGEADLAPLADLAHDLFADVELAAKEGLALVNNNAFSTGMAALALVDTRRLVETMTVAGALDLEAFAANLTILDPLVARVRPYGGLSAESDRLRAALKGSHLWGARVARNLQDPLSYRSIAHVHGAARDALTYAEQQMAVELNAHDSNPLVHLDEDRILSAAAFEALPVAGALDFVRLALAPALTGCLERTVKLLQAPISGLPSGLATPGTGGQGGLAEFSWVLHAMTVEARLLAQPVSFELATTTTEEGIADRVSMAPLAARRLAEQIDLGWRILAVGLVCATLAVDLRNPPALGETTGQVRALVRDRVPVGPGAPFPADLEPVVALVRSGALADVLDRASSPE